MNTATKTKKQADATRRLMEALDRMIVAAHQAERARDDLIKQQKRGGAA